VAAAVVAALAAGCVGGGVLTRRRMRVGKSDEYQAF